jgi:dTDP-4-amino-4,6-dideoxygalactose transaminase
LTFPTASPTVPVVPSTVSPTAPPAPVPEPAPPPGREVLSVRHVAFRVDAAAFALAREHLAAHGIASAVHYPVAIHRTQAYASVEQPSLPVSEALAVRSCSLPMHPDMSDDDVARVAEVVGAYAVTRSESAA